MSKFTIQLKSLLDNSNIDVKSYLADYPLYNFKKLFQNSEDFGNDYKGVKITNFRDYLNNKIFEHFYFSEIGAETGDLFCFFLRRRMKEIMPFYNQRFESIDIEFNPLWNVDLTETYTHNVADTGNSTVNATGKTTENGTSKTEENLEQNSHNSSDNSSTRTPNITNETVNAEMDTAQSLMTTEDIKANNYLSKANHNVGTETGTEVVSGESSENGNITNDNNIEITNDNEINNTNSSNSNNTSNRTETYTRKQEGSSAGYLFTQNIQEWRKIMVNIPLEIIAELNDLFMGIY